MLRRRRPCDSRSASGRAGLDRICGDQAGAGPDHNQSPTSPSSHVLPFPAPSTRTTPASHASLPAPSAPRRQTGRRSTRPPPRMRCPARARRHPTANAAATPGICQPKRIQMLRLRPEAGITSRPRRVAANVRWHPAAIRPSPRQGIAWRRVSCARPFVPPGRHQQKKAAVRAPRPSTRRVQQRPLRHRTADTVATPGMFQQKRIQIPRLRPEAGITSRPRRVAANNQLASSRDPSLAAPRNRMAPRVLHATLRSARPTPARKGRCPRTLPQRAPYPAPALGHRTADTAATPGMFQPKRIKTSKPRPALGKSGRNRPDCIQIPTGIQPSSAPRRVIHAHGGPRFTRPPLLYPPDTGKKGPLPVPPPPPRSGIQPGDIPPPTPRRWPCASGKRIPSSTLDRNCGRQVGYGAGPYPKVQRPHPAALRPSPRQPPARHTASHAAPFAPSAPAGHKKKAAPKDRPISHPAIAGAIRSRCDTVRCR